MSVSCKFYLDVQAEQDLPTTVRLKCSHAAGHSDEHRLGVNWPLGEKRKLKVPDLRPMDFFTLFGERYQVEAASGTTVWARLTIASAGFDNALRATFDVRWLAKRASDFQRLAVTRFPKSEMVPVAMVELNEAA